MVEQIVAELSFGADEMEAEAVGSEIEHAEPGDLFADSVLYLIRQIEGCGCPSPLPLSWLAISSSMAVRATSSRLPCSAMMTPA